MIKSLLLLGLSFISLAAHALASDRAAPIEFKAGHVVFNEKSGEGIYTRGVAIDQGSLHLRAERASTQTDAAHRLTRAAAFGTPGKKAHVWMKTTPDKPPLHVYADTIYYHPLTHELELIGHAHIIEGSNTFKAPHIRYDTKAERVVTTAKNDEGTVILIDPDAYPEKKHE